jgi:hypothetical protein
MRVPAVLLRAGAPFAQLWWRIRRPTTFGVKALIRHPDGRFLVVRHSYADTRRWALPGGGYKPARETPAESELSVEPEPPHAMGGDGVLCLVGGRAGPQVVSGGL